MYNLKNYDDKLYFTCSLIEYLARETNNKKSYIVNKIGENEIKRLYDLAEINHCLPMERLLAEIVEEFDIEIGNYHNLENLTVKEPTIWGIGMVFMNLILNTLESVDNISSKYYAKAITSNTMVIYNSWIVEHIDNYNNIVFTYNSSYLLASYLGGELI